MRIHRRGKERRPPLAPLVRRVLELGEVPDQAEPGWLEAFTVQGQLLHATRPDAPEAVPAWATWGESITAEWIEQHPGSRPFAWWVLEARKPRRVLTAPDTVAEFLGNGARPFVWRLNLGVSVQAWELEDGEGDVEIESQATYLKRFRLLGDRERRALTAEDFAPETISPSSEEEQPLEADA